MDLTPATKSPTPTTTPTTTTPETDTETPPTKSTDYHLHQFHRPSSSTKLISFTNGGLKQHSHQHSHQHQLVIRNPAAVVVVVYKECLKNHAASLGGHALDGCGEFMPSPSAISTDPTSLKCAACGCHRNFHRRDPDNIDHFHQQTGTQIVQLHHHRHTPTSSSPRDHSPSPNSVSPPPISSSYNFPANSAPHMLLALSAGHHVSPDHHQHTTTATVMTTATVPTKSSLPATPVMMGINSNGGKKRFRTKFSQEQKDKMYSFSEKVGWKMQKRDEGLVEELCNEIGVSRGVLKVWMHNNKHTFGKSATTRDLHHPLDLDHHEISGSSPNTHHYHHINLHKHQGSSSTTSHDHEHEHEHEHDHGVTNGTGGSSSS